MLNVSSAKKVWVVLVGCALLLTISAIEAGDKEESRLPCKNISQERLEKEALLKEILRQIEDSQEPNDSSIHLFTYCSSDDCHRLESPL